VDPWDCQGDTCLATERCDAEKGCVADAPLKLPQCGAVMREVAGNTCCCGPADLDCVIHCRRGPSKTLLERTFEGRARSEELPDCERRCAAGHAPSCLRLGATLTWDTPHPARQARGAALHAKACEAGYTPACEGLTFLYDWLPSSRSHPNGARWAMRACDEGTARFLTCQWLAVAFRDGRGALADPDRAEHYRVRACELKAEGCVAFAARIGDPKEREKAFEKCRESDACALPFSNSER
jgi:hypothetical protein